MIRYDVRGEKTLSIVDNNKIRLGGFYRWIHGVRCAHEFRAAERAFLPVFPLKLEDTMLRVIYPALKETRHSGYKRDNKEY